MVTPTPLRFGYTSAVARKPTAAAFGLGTNIFAVFVLIGIYMPFFPVWLESRGMDEAQIGILLGLSPWARALVNPLAGASADRRGSPRRLLLGLCLAVIVGYAVLLSAWSFWTLLLGLVVVGCAFGPIVPLVDAVAIRARDRIDYGKIRSAGSVAFIAAAFGGGWLFERVDDDAIVWSMIGGAVTLLLAVLWLLPREAAPEAPMDHTGPRPRPIRGLISQRGFRRFLAAASVLMASHAVLYGFASLHWSRAGISESMIGALWSVGVVAEIVFFVAGRRLVDGLGPRGLLLIAGLGGIVRWATLGATTSLGWLFAAQVLHALTFAALHLGAIGFISEHAARERSSAAQTLYSAVASGLVFGIGMPAAGWGFKLFGGQAFWAMACLSGLGCALVFMMPRRGQALR